VEKDIMNPLVLKLLSMVPWFKIALWLIAELGWKLKVAQWLAAENTWYFDLAAKALGYKNPNEAKAALAS
jgi:hypothetical protein